MKYIYKIKYGSSSLEKILKPITKKSKKKWSFKLDYT